jgi:hypothetical protein
LNAAATDVHRTVEYRTDRWFVGWLPYALLVALLGLYILIYESSRHRIAGLVLLGVGTVYAAVMLTRYFTPSRPRVVLSPAGLMLRVAMKDVMIPWREIESVDATDHKVWNSARGIPIRVTYRNCTMIQVSQRFYREAIHVDSFFMRGPGWDYLFIPRDNSVVIALHHEQFSVAPDDVREPIEERWREFRGRSDPVFQAQESASAVPHVDRPPDAPYTRSPFPFAVQDPLRMGSAPHVTSTWERIKLAVPLVGILLVLSNAVGVWETASQEDARIAREANAEELRQEKAERDKRQKDWDDVWKKFDDNMRRVHGDWKR